MKSFLPLFFAVSFIFLAACGDDEKDPATSTEPVSDAYPEDKVLENTNLDSSEPLELSKEFETVEKRILIASLMRQKNDLLYKIREMKSSSAGTGSNSDSPGGSLDQLQSYIENIDKEIAKVRNTPSENLAEVQETALDAIEGAGALIQSPYIRIDSGF